MKTQTTVNSGVMTVFVDGEINTITTPELAKAVEKVFDLRPDGMIQKLGLRRPLFAETAAYGHFGNPAYPWEKTDMQEALKKAVSEITL